MYNFAMSAAFRRSWSILFYGSEGCRGSDDWINDCGHGRRLAHDVSGIGTMDCINRKRIIKRRGITMMLNIAMLLFILFIQLMNMWTLEPMTHLSSMFNSAVGRALTTRTLQVPIIPEPLPQPKRWSDVKLAIYMTTHMPKSHELYLPCWRDAIQRMEIFKYADLILYTASQPTAAQLEMLPFRNVIIKTYNNTAKQAGAVQAMIDPFVEKVTWFDEYDWVIRLNPDVLIRSDNWLISTMLDPNINGIFNDCKYTRKYAAHPRTKLHTDFYAFRPVAVDRELVLRSNNTNAEYHMTAALWNIYQSNQFAYLEGAELPRKGVCRIVGVNSPVVHAHSTWRACPYYYNVTNGEEYSVENEDGLY
jgi:hypothetical protein